MCHSRPSLHSAALEQEALVGGTGDGPLRDACAVGGRSAPYVHGETARPVDQAHHAAALVGHPPLLTGRVGVRLLGDVGAGTGARDLEYQAAAPGPDAVITAVGGEKVELLV